MFLTHGLITRRSVSLSLLVCLFLCFTVNDSASVVVGEQISLRPPSRIVFDNIRPSVESDRSISVSAKVLDDYGYEVPEARVTWSIVEDWRHLVTINTAYSDSHTVTITGHKDAETREAFVTLRATTGSVSSSLIVRYTNQNQAGAFNHYAVQPGSEPADIELMDENNKPIEQIDLPVGSKQVVYARVYDKSGNRISGEQVRWKLAKTEYAKYVLFGQQVNNYATNSLELAWGAGDPTVKIPSEVHIMVTCRGASNVLTVNYKQIARQKIKITADKTQVEVLPGEQSTFTIKVTGDKGADITGDVNIDTPELLDETAKNLIVVTGPDDDHKISLFGRNGTGDTPPLLESALLVRVGSASFTIPVNYRRDPVSAIWEVLPPRIVGDNYGRTIKMDYYCIEVEINNNSGSDLALAALAFTLKTPNDPRPNTSYTTVHGSLARRKLTYPRTLTLAAISASGQLMTGFNPFFHNTEHARNFAQFVDIISNPLEKGVDKVWPDSYPDELNRLEQDTLHDDKLIPNNTRYKTKIFFPKRVVFRNGAKDRDDPATVRQALGELVIFGYKFQRGPMRKIR